MSWLLLEDTVLGLVVRVSMHGFLWFKIFLYFIYFWLCWVFVAVGASL